MRLAALAFGALLAAPGCSPRTAPRASHSAPPSAPVVALSGDAASTGAASSDAAVDFAHDADAPLLDGAADEARAAVDSAAPAAGSARIVLEGRGAVRGILSERLSLEADGTLRAGPFAGSAGLEGGADWAAHASLAVVSLDRARQLRAVLFVQAVDESEDPPNRYQLFVPWHGALVRVLDRAIGTYGVTQLRIPGDGTVRYVEDGWEACERQGHPGAAPRDEVRFRVLGPADGGSLARPGLPSSPDAAPSLAPEQRRATGLVQRCTDLAG